MHFVYAPFREADFPEYKSWYEDADLHARLGPMDDEWLTHVMKKEDGLQYSVFLDGALIAVIGLLLPNERHPAYYITDVAVKPSLRSKGVGSEILQQFMVWHGSETCRTWRAFVDARNSQAKAFFERNGWSSSDAPDEHGMWLLEWTASH